MTYRKLAFFLPLFMVPFFPLSQATAQNTATEAFSIEEIVVTARRREESLQDTPLAVTSFSEAEMDLRGHLNVNDIASSTPNVNIEQSSNTSGLTNSPTVFIRGIGQQDFVINTDPAVGIYVDGVYIARSIGSMMDVMDLERAEVLRGPQGTLFGRNTLAGALNLVTKRPNTEAFDAKFTLAAGDNGYSQINGAFNIPLATDLAARISVMDRKRGGYVQATNYDDLWLGDDNTQAIRGQLEFAPTDSIRVNLSADYSKSRAAPSPMIAENIGNGYGDKTALIAASTMQAYWWNNSAPMQNASFSGLEVCKTLAGQQTDTRCHGQSQNPGPDVYETTAVWHDIHGNRDPDPTNKVDTLGAALVFEADTSLGTFKSITAYRGFESDFRNDHDYGAILIFSNINDDFHQDGRSQEFQLVGNAMDDKLDYTVGLYTFAETGTERVSLVGVNGLFVTQGRENGVIPPTSTMPWSGMSGMNPKGGARFQRIVRDIDNTSSAAYGQITYHFDSPLHLTAGVRATKDEKSFDVTIHRDYCPANANSVVQPVGGPTSNGDGLISKDKITDVCQLSTGAAAWDEVDPMITLAYDLNDTTMIYGTYSTGFRDGGFASRFPDGLPDTMPAFKPEYVTNFEAGIKTELFDGTVRFNAAVFDTTYDDMQVAAVPVAIARGTGIENIGVGRLKGLEIETLWIVNDNLRLDATVGLLDANLESVVGGGFTTGGFKFYDPASSVTCTASATLACIALADVVLPYTPETNFTIGATHRFPLSSGSNVTTRLDVIHNDAQQFKITNQIDMNEDAYNVVNLSTTYNSAGLDWALTLGVRNATNAVYSTAGSFSTGNGNSALNISRPREAYLRYQHWLGN